MTDRKIVHSDAIQGRTGGKRCSWYKVAVQLLKYSLVVCWVDLREKKSILVSVVIQTFEYTR